MPRRSTRLTTQQESSAAVAFDELVRDARRVLQATGARPEISLYSQFETFLARSFERLGATVSIIQQAAADQGVPDYRVERGGELLGWVELKAVFGKDLNRLDGHDQRQLERFASGLSNVLYTNGWQWRLYQDGAQVTRDVVVGPEDTFRPEALEYPPSAATLDALDSMFETFLAHAGTPYRTPQEAVTALAVRAKSLKLALLEVGRDGAGQHLQQLHEDFRSLLFKNGAPFTWERFVDSYVQIATFGLLLWRLEVRTDIRLDSQVTLSQGQHPLLFQSLSILWSPAARLPILEPLLENLCRTINLVDPDLFAPSASATSATYVTDPIVHAYEPFFSAYDRAAREANGVYYTPVEVVQHIVSGVDDRLRNSFGHADGVLDSNARFLDPATGTGTFLLGLANEVAAKAQAAGLPPDQLVGQVLTDQTAAFELFPGPYAIAHQRLEAALRTLGAPPTVRLPVYLADTLAAPTSGALGGSGFGVVGGEIVHERERADEVKTQEELLVILGNPPWERLKAREAVLEPFATELLNILRVATPPAARRDLKSTRDLYVAFWMWALWALQPPHVRQATAEAPTVDPALARGMIAFVTNRTWIHGRSLIGLRSLIRQGAREVWICDLGGDARGGFGVASFAGRDQNVFDIQTGAAIAWVVFDPAATDTGCKVMYRRIYGSRVEKFAELSKPFDPTDYVEVKRAGGETMLPDQWESDVLSSAPHLTDLFDVEPFTGFQTARDKAKDPKVSPIAVDSDTVLSETLIRGGRAGAGGATTKVLGGALGNWARLSATRRAAAWATAQQTRSGTPAPDPARLSTSKLRRVLYRPLDWRWVYDDPAWITWYREDLHEIYDGDPVPAIVTVEDNHGRGPAVMHSSTLMEQHSFRGSAGGRSIFPLYRRPGDHGATDLFDLEADTEGRQHALSRLCTDWLGRIGRSGQVEAAYSYILAVLSAPTYTEHNWQALTGDALRVPLTEDVDLFDDIVGLGDRVRAAWELRVTPDPSIRWGGTPSQEPLGDARWDGNHIRFANGRTIEGVTSAVWDFELSGYRVLARWLEARTHWRVTAERAREVQMTISAAATIVALFPELDSALQRLLA